MVSSFVCFIQVYKLSFLHLEHKVLRYIFDESIKFFQPSDTQSKKVLKCFFSDIASFPDQRLSAFYLPAVGFL